MWGQVTGDKERENVEVIHHIQIGHLLQQNKPYGGNVISEELLYNLLVLLPYSPDYNLLNKHPSGNPNLPL